MRRWTWRIVGDGLRRRTTIESTVDTVPDSPSQTTLSIPTPRIWALGRTGRSDRVDVSTPDGSPVPSPSFSQRRPYSGVLTGGRATVDSGPTVR